MEEADKWICGQMTAACEVHTQRNLFECHATIYCATRSTLAPPSFGATLAFFVFCIPWSSEGDVLVPLLWPLSSSNHPWASSALIRHHRPRLDDARADRCQHLSVCCHHHLCCVSQHLNLAQWKYLDEIYKIYMLFHRSDLNISAKFVKAFV